MRIRDFIEAISVYPDDLDITIVVDNISNLEYFQDMHVEYFECSQPSNQCRLHCSLSWGKERR